MANILVAEVTVCGRPQDKEDFLAEIAERFYFDAPEIDYDTPSYQTQFFGEFRWNIENTLTRPDVLQACKDFHCSISAHGHEPGVGFYESVAINQFGEIVQNQSWELYIDTAWFDPRDEVYND